MDLRNQNCHLHYIHVIKKGTVVELMNQSPSGVPARKFRDINDIYDDEDSLRDITLAGNNLGSSASDADCSKERLRIFICSAGATLWEDPFSDGAACHSTYDSISDELTLQQILKKCKKKGKKRKTPESVIGNETSTTGHEHSLSQADDDFSDLILPLSCLMPNIRNKRRVKVVDSPSQNTLVDFDKYEDAPPDKYHQQQMESTTQHINLASTTLQPSCSHNEDDNKDCSLDSLNPVSLNPTIVDLPGETADGSRGSKMMVEEHAGRFLQNPESHSDSSTTYSPRVMTVHNEAEIQKYPDGASQSLQQGCLYDPSVAKFRSQEDDSPTPLSDVSTYAVSLSMDLASEEPDRSIPQPFTNEIISQVGNDTATFPCTMKASVEPVVLAMPELVCESVKQLSQTSLIVLEENVQERTHVTPLPHACLHALSNSVDHISDEHGNSEPFCIENELDSLTAENLVSDEHGNSEPCCIENELDSLTAENLVSVEHGNEPCCIENEMDSLVTENLVESDFLSDRFTINKENEFLPSSEECFQTGLSHLPVTEVNAEEDTSTASLLDVPLDAFTSPVNHTSDDNDPMDMHNDYDMNLAGQLNSVNQQIDDQFVGGPVYEVNTTGEHLHTVKEIIEDAKTFSPRDCLITCSTEDISESACSTLSCNSESGIPTNHTGRDDEMPSATSCSATETSNSISTESRGSLDNPLAPEGLFSERKASSPSLQKELRKAMENIDTIDSREKLRSLGKLVSDNQIKQKKRSIAKAIAIKGCEQLYEFDMHKHSGSKKSGSPLELKHGGIKKPHLLSSPGRDKKRGQCIPGGPEGAILFSKKQMQDFEALAKKLTRELASMKEIIEERLNHKAGVPDHNNDQVITAINKALKAEQTARKRLSTMNRDCIRFCKIMKISENTGKDTANSETTAQKKERKKIKFADEAGGELCQIKFIESDEVSAPAGDI